MTAKKTVTLAQVAKYIDHTLLQPFATSAQILDLCAQAKEAQTATVCVRPVDIALAAEYLAGSGVGVCTVIGFPHGTTLPSVKAFESKEAVHQGATEIDMVLNVGWMKEKKFDLVFNDIKGVVDAVRGTGTIVKVIIECANLTDEEKIKACELSEAAGADFVKTSTGFAAHGSTPRDLVLMRKSVSEKVQVKAAGGIRNLDNLLQALACGATRIGASATMAMIEEFISRVGEDGEITLPDVEVNEATVQGGY